MSSTDRNEKKVTLKAPRGRVWRALASAEEFGVWFGVKLEGAFKKGVPLNDAGWSTQAKSIERYVS